MTHTDIRTQHILYRIAPAPLHPYIKIARLDRPIGIWLLLYPGLWGLLLAAGGIQGLHRRLFVYAALFTLGAVLMRSAGCVINDLWDRDLDKNVARTRLRPLPAGELTAGQALGFLGVLLLLSFAILLQFNTATIVLGLMSIIPVIIYPLMKRFTSWPQLFLGITFNWGALMGWTAIVGNLSLPAVLMYIGGVFWTLGYDTIYAHQDKEDDARIGIKSTALLFGDKSRIAVGGFYAAATLFLVIAAYNAGAPVTLGFLPALHFIWQLCTWDGNKPESSLRIFNANNLAGFLILVLYACII